MLKLELYRPSTSLRHSPPHIPFPLKVSHCTLLHLATVLTSISQTAGSPLSPRSQLGLDSSEHLTLTKWPCLMSLQYGGHPTTDIGPETDGDKHRGQSLVSGFLGNIAKSGWEY